MHPIVLSPLPFDLDIAEVYRRLRLKPESPRAAGLAELVEAARALARPRAAYLPVAVTATGDDRVEMDGVSFTSRILRVNLDQAACAYLFVCTAGSELADWTAAQADFLLQFYADAISQVVLSSALASLQQAIRERHGTGRLARLSPGSLPDWPLDAQRPLFGLLGGAVDQIGVALTDSLLMVPTKSVSGILFAGHEGFTSCRLCPRDGCPNRKAEHDPELYGRDYAAQGAASDA